MVMSYLPVMSSPRMSPSIARSNHVFPCRRHGLQEPFRMGILPRVRVSQDRLSGSRRSELVANDDFARSRGSSDLPESLVPRRSSVHNGCMRYRGMVIRPPSEADSYILQITYGCSHNSCTFCGTYRGKPFRIRAMEEVLEDIALVQERLPETQRVFLADGNALTLETERLVVVLDALASAFPRLRRIGIYASPVTFWGRAMRTLPRCGSGTCRSSTLGWRAEATRCFAA